MCMLLVETELVAHWQDRALLPTFLLLVEEMEHNAPFRALSAYHDCQAMKLLERRYWTMESLEKYHSAMEWSEDCCLAIEELVNYCLATEQAECDGIVVVVQAGIELPVFSTGARPLLQKSIIKEHRYPETVQIC